MQSPCLIQVLNTINHGKTKPTQSTALLQANVIEQIQNKASNYINSLQT